MNIIKDKKNDYIVINIKSSLDALTLGYLYSIIPNNVGFFIDKDILNEDLIYLQYLMPRIFNEVNNLYYSKEYFDVNDYYILEEDDIESEVSDSIVISRSIDI